MADVLTALENDNSTGSAQPAREADLASGQVVSLACFLKTALRIIETVSTEINSLFNSAQHAAAGDPRHDHPLFERAGAGAGVGRRLRKAVVSATMPFRVK